MKTSRKYADATLFELENDYSFWIHSHLWYPQNDEDIDDNRGDRLAEIVNTFRNKNVRKLPIYPLFKKFFLDVGRECPQGFMRVFLALVTQFWHDSVHSQIEQRHDGERDFDPLLAYLGIVKFIELNVSKSEPFYTLQGEADIIGGMTSSQQSVLLCHEAFVLLLKLIMLDTPKDNYCLFTGFSSIWNELPRITLLPHLNTELVHYIIRWHGINKTFKQPEKVGLLIGAVNDWANWLFNHDTKYTIVYEINLEGCFGKPFESKIIAALCGTTLEEIPNHDSYRLDDWFEFWFQQSFRPRFLDTRDSIGAQLEFRQFKRRVDAIISTGSDQGSKTQTLIMFKRFAEYLADMDSEITAQIEEDRKRRRQLPAHIIMHCDELARFLAKAGINITTRTLNNYFHEDPDRQFKRYKAGQKTYYDVLTLPGKVKIEYLEKLRKLKTGELKGKYEYSLVTHQEVSDGALIGITWETTGEGKIPTKKRK